MKNKPPLPAVTEKDNWPLWILIFALGIRLIYLFQIRQEPWFIQPMLDAQYYDDWARRIAAGDWIGKEVFFMSPGYPYFLAVFYKFIGRSMILVALAQALAGAFSCLLVYKMGSRAFGKTAARIAALLFAAYNAAIFNEMMLLKVALIHFTNILMLFFLLKGMESKRIKWLFFAGLMLGCSVQLRPTILLFAPLAAVWVIAIFIQQRRLALKAATVFGLGILGATLPVALRNYFVGGEFLFTTAHGGINFYLGNHPAFDGLFNALPFARTDPRFEQKDYQAEASRRAGRPLNEKEATQFWYDESFRFIRENPSRWMRQLATKFIVFWHPYEYPINIDFNYFAKRARTILNFSFVNYGLISITALLGLVLCFGELFKRPAWSGPLPLFFMYVAAYLASGVIFFVVSEYRMPVVCGLVLFSGKSGAWLYEKYKTGRIAPVFAGLIFCAGVFSFLRFGTQVSISNPCNSRYNLAQYFLEQNHVAEGIRELEAAVKDCPEYFDARLSLAGAYFRAGEMDAALENLRVLKKMRPENYEVDLRLGNLAFSQKQYAAALRYYQNALSRSDVKTDSIAEIRTNLGNALVRLNHFNEAIEQYQTALAIRPDQAETYNNQAYAYTRLGQRDKAIASYQKAIELKPDYQRAKDKLAQLLQGKSHP